MGSIYGVYSMAFSGAWLSFQTNRASVFSQKSLLLAIPLSELHQHSGTVRFFRSEETIGDNSRTGRVIHSFILKQAENGSATLLFRMALLVSGSEVGSHR